MSRGFEITRRPIRAGSVAEKLIGRASAEGDHPRRFVITLERIANGATVGRLRPNLADSDNQDDAVANQRPEDAEDEREVPGGGHCTPPLAVAGANCVTLPP